LTCEAKRLGCVGMCAMTKNAAAVELGRLGGKVRSEAKAAAARLNGVKGGVRRASTVRRSTEANVGNRQQIVVDIPKRLG